MVDHQLNNQSQTLASLFGVPGRTFEIPVYQRAYSWDDDQIKQFLDDLREAQDSYYLGHYLFEQASEITEGKLWVIDGQQRLTTCILFFHALCQELQARANYAASHQQAAQWHEIFLQSSDSPLWKLKTVDYDNPFFQRLLDGVLLPTKQEDTKSTLLIKSAYNQFSKVVKSAQVTELLHWGKLVADADVTHLIVRDKKQAAQLFAFQNDRGKQLTNLEIVKSYLMLQVLLFGQGKQASSFVLPILEEKFATIYKSVTRIDLTEDEVLAYYWRSTLANAYSGNPVVESIKKALGEAKGNRVAWVVKFVQELADAFQHVYEIEQDIFQAAKDLRTLNNMSLSYPILLRAYRDRITRPTQERLFSFLENITFRHKLRGGRAVIHDRLVYHFFGNIVTLHDEELHKQIDQFIRMLRTDGWSWGWHWGDEAMQQILNQNFYGNPVDNYLLWRYERVLGRDNPSTKPYDQFIANESIEHIAPQTPRAEEADSPDWPGYGIYYDTKQPSEGIASGEWLNKLGNLMLLSQGQNSRVSNRAFTEKMAEFREGQLRQHRLEVFLALDPAGEGKKLLLWDKAAIERRHKHIVEAVTEIWSLDNLKR